jgi:hypothetical protein
VGPTFTFADDREAYGDPLEATKHFSPLEILWVEAFPVRYDKDAVSDLSSNQSVRHRLPYGQKASQFEGEREYRFVVAMPGVRHGAPECLDLQLGHPERFGNHCASGSAV